MADIVILALQIFATIVAWKYWKWKALLPIGGEIIITFLLGVCLMLGKPEDIILAWLAILIIFVLLILVVMCVIKM